MSVKVAAVGDQLTPAEEAFFTSGGQDISAFEPPAPSPAPDAGTPAPDPAPSEPAAVDAGGQATPAAAAAPANPAMPQTDDELFAEIEKEAVDGTGKLANGGQFIRRENFRVVSTKYKQTKEELKTEREQRQKEQSELNDLRQKFSRLDERLRLFNEALTPPAAGQQQAAPEKKPMPDPADDLFGAFNWAVERIGQLEERINKTSQDASKTAETFQQSTAETNLRQAYANDFQSFAGQQPDIGHAYLHYVKVRHATLQAAGYVDQEERNQIIQNEERDIATRAFQAKQSPASIIYNIAKHVGYVKPADPPSPAPAPQTANPAPTAPAAAKPAPSAVDEVNRVAAAQAASRSLSTGGGAPVVQMSIDQLLAMSDSDFAAYERANPGVVKQLMGG